MARFEFPSPRGLALLVSSRSGQLEQSGFQLSQTVDLRYDTLQRLHRSRHVLEEMFVPFDEAEEAVGAECLHEALHSAQAKFEVELAVYHNSVFELPVAIVRRQLSAFGFGKIDIWIVEQRGEILFGQAGPHPLEIDQVRLAVTDDNVLRLKIAVHKNSWERCQALCDFL